ncbi:MAG: NAD-dependent epimerase/dehydratase family protein [Lachnospiraceae bacterium]|nr:NAD-dependent epimerase/dehydratase family protein [Lachnospiraceae bacterium]
MEGKKETVLVTGATGFLGEYLIKRLLREYRVLAMGRNRERGRFLASLGAVFCEGDFTEAKQCAGYVKEADYVIHAGALSSVWGAWEEFYRTNVLGTKTILRLCRKYGVKRLVYVSSPSVYSGTRDRLEIKEEQAPKKNTLNHYIRSKLLAEKLLLRQKEVPVVILRPRGLIGVGDTSLVPRLLRANRTIGIPLFRGGKNLVDMTSVENAALACHLALTAKGAEGGIFNITNGEPAEFKELLEQFLTAAGESPHYRRLPFRALYCAAAVLEKGYRLFRVKGEPPLTRYTVCMLAFSQTMDISRARKLLGYRPEKTLEESIREYGEWYRKGSADPLPPAFPDPPGLITAARICHCGFCINDLARMFRGRSSEKRRFPAGVVLLTHKRLGTIVYDTGYSEQILHGGPLLKLYCLLNPVSVTREQTIVRQLEKRGIPAGSAKHVILSHAHPDHVGGLSLIPGYTLTAFPVTLAAAKKSSLLKLSFRELLPPAGHILAERKPQNRLYEHFLCRYFEEVYDLFDDGSVIGVRLPGHCDGQLGLWLPDQSLFLAADACWGTDLLEDTPRMRLLARLIQNDFAAYRDTVRRLCRLKHDYPRIRIICSHDGGKEQIHGEGL